MKLGQFFACVFGGTYVDASLCYSHMVPFDQPEAALVSCLRGDHPPENVLTHLCSHRTCLRDGSRIFLWHNILHPGRAQFVVI